MLVISYILYAVVHREKMEKRKGYFVSLHAAVSVAELPSGISICCGTKDGLGDILLLLFCALPSIGEVGLLGNENGKLSLYPSKRKPERTGYEAIASVGS